MKFFKKHLASILLLIVSIVLVVLSSISHIFFTLSMATFSIMSLVECIISRKKYRELDLENSEDSVYFDARKYDYDEDIYLIDERKQKTYFRSKIDKFNARTPFIMWSILSLCFAFMAIYSIFKMR